MTDTNGGGASPPLAWRREGAVVAAAFALCLLGGAMSIEDKVTAPPVAAYVLAAVSCAVLPLRHRAPTTTLAATIAAGMLAPALDLLLTPFIITPAIVTAYSLAVRGERRAVGGALLASAGLLAIASLFGAYSWKDASRMVVVAASPVMAGVLGHAAQNRRAYLAAVEERARRAEESRELEARRRVEEERVRIARELHDLVAHQITLANAQASVAAHLFDTRPEQTRKSLQELIDTTGDALDDLRATVGLLRRSGDAADPAEPAPGLSRLPTLLQSFRRAGLEVSFRQEGAARPLPPGLDLTAYRIVQEALTNVTKHAGTERARVDLTWNRDRVTITVTDDGDGARTTPDAARDRPPGYGLIGMRERATAVGGHLSAGRRPDGGFVVSTDLPLPPARDTGAARTEPADDRAGDAP
ncbi:sensor histidine kinase [Actinomadura sp. GC306]|uniref:sensor histidine kinase n=1 Tax=Actinomadura sp. GC306 TaxID=2530367 RepID=UPI001049DDAC|nr:sensor histidine kinase [Actinomadura sp. GC306]TDC64960.1 sensor histidine kinase [Actinomadura sp. GC306]